MVIPILTLQMFVNYSLTKFLKIIEIMPAWVWMIICTEKRVLVEDVSGPDVPPHSGQVAWKGWGRRRPPWDGSKWMNAVSVASRNVMNVWNALHYHEMHKWICFIAKDKPCLLSKVITHMCFWKSRQIPVQEKHGLKTSFIHDNVHNILNSL